MALQIHPEPGTIVICDFRGMETPEMTKRRPAIVISPRLRGRGSLCTIVPLSTTAPRQVMGYHHRLTMSPPLPEPFADDHAWVKGDLVYTLSFSRMRLPFSGKDNGGVRVYDVRVIDEDDLRAVRACVLHGLGLSTLTAHI